MSRRPRQQATFMYALRAIDFVLFRYYASWLISRFREVICFTLDAAAAPNASHATSRRPIFITAI